jgi:hypothetical protein
MDIPQSVESRTAEDEVTNLHTQSTKGDHHMAEVLKKISPLPDGKWPKIT